MYNRRYHKAYWMMQQETTGYGLQQGTPWGSCLLEIKNGKGYLTVTAEMLLPLGKGHYGVYAILAAKEKEKAIFCGRLYPNDNGHGVMQWDFSPDHLAGSFLAEDIFAVVLLAEETGQQGLPAPLTAYAKEKRNWRRAFSEQPVEKGEEKEEQSHDVILLRAAETLCSTEKCIQMEKEEPMTLPKERKQGESPQASDNSPKENHSPSSFKEEVHGSFRGLLQKFRQEMYELEEMGILTAEESRRLQGISEPPKCQEKEGDSAKRQEDITERTRIEARIQLAQENNDADREKETEPCSCQEEIAEKKKNWIFADHPAIYPFGDNEKWVCIQPEEMVLLDDVPPHWQTDFFYLLPWHRDKHFIIRKEGEQVFLGIPDTYSPKEQKRAASHGFPTFRSIEGQKDLGYWLGRLQG